MESSPAIYQTKRNVGLDLFRVSLALLIFLFHSNMHFDCHYGIFDHFVRLGAIAMTGFFMLSGYALNLSNKNVLTDISEYKKFLLKRLISIVPLYYFVAIIHVLFFSSDSWQSELLLFPIEALGLQSFFSSLFTVSHNGGTWFISCLLPCYLLFPFLQWLFRNLSGKEKMVLGGAILSILFISPIVQHHFLLASLYDNPFFRILEFSIGVLIAVLHDEDHEWMTLSIFQSKMFLILIMVLLMTGVGCGDIIFPDRDYMLMNWVVLPCLIVMFLIFRNVSFRSLDSSRLLQYLSKLSYAFFLAQFYVWTISSIVVFKILNKDANSIRIIVSFVCCLVVSTFLHEVIEKPIKNYLIKKRRHA